LRTVVRLAPLVSIDLVILNRANEALLGYRTNRPAKGKWFVPGGRVKKGERIKDALVRIARNETGIKVLPGSAVFAGVHEHFYMNSVFSASRSLTTHYVVLAFRITLRKDPELRLDSQHTRLAWFPAGEILRMGTVHKNTKAYFRTKRA